MKTIVAATIASILTILFVAAFIFGETPAVGFVGLVCAVIWLVLERKRTDGNLQKRLWKGTLVAAILGVIFYGVLGYIASTKDSSGGLVMLALIIGLLFVLPGIFGVAGTAMRLQIRK